MPTSPSSTTVGAGRAGGSGKSPVRGGGAVRQRKTGGSGATAPRSVGPSGGTSWRFFTEDSPGFKVEPVPVLVMSILYIVAVFLLHLWGKYSRG